MQRENKLRLLDVFAGCGGMTLGFEMTGLFESVYAVELNPDASETYRTNFGDHCEAASIEAIREFPVVDVLIGGPPCQGFSTLNKERVGLERRNLWKEYLRALDESQAAAFVMENVPQFLGSPEYAAFASESRKRGFRVEERVLNAADYGVPQRRKRAIVIGIKSGAVTWPCQTHFMPEEVPLAGRPWATFREATGDLPINPNGKNWHTPRNPRPISMERYKTIPGEGEGRFELAERRPDITPACWINKQSGSTDVFGRLWWDRPAYTIRTEFVKPEKGRYLHPEAHRPITIREAARCMSFPDSFLFPESQSMTSVAKQVGNAVPPLLAKAIGSALATAISCGEENHLQLAA